MRCSHAQIFAEWLNRIRYFYQILDAAKKILNNYNSVQAIVSKCVEYQNTIHGDDIIQSIANICYYLLSSKKSGFHEYK